MKTVTPRTPADDEAVLGDGDVTTALVVEVASDRDVTTTLAEGGAVHSPTL